MNDVVNKVVHFMQSCCLLFQMLCIWSWTDSSFTALNLLQLQIGCRLITISLLYSQMICRLSICFYPLLWHQQLNIFNYYFIPCRTFPDSIHTVTYSKDQKFATENWRFDFLLLKVYGYQSANVGVLTHVHIQSAVIQAAANSIYENNQSS